MKTLAAVAFITVILTLSSVAQSSVRVGAAAPAFSGVSMNGTEYDLNDMRGSVVVLTFWSTRCAICHSEIPKVNSMVGGYDRRKVAFLSLTMENSEKVNSYLRRNRFASEILPDSFGVVLKYADRSSNGIINMGFPAYFVIDQRGIVQHRSSGYDKTPQVAAAIDRLVTR
jgi:peroxiredoxin